MLIDTHCHIQFKAFYDDVESVIVRCKEKGMILNLVGTQAETSKRAVEWAEKYEWMYASVGLHPIQEYKTKVEEEADVFVTKGEQFDYEYYKSLAMHPKVIAIGETGLDRFHIPKNIDPEVVMNKQKETFLEHARLAREVEKPLVIHIREAYEDMLECLPELRENTGVIHCYAGNWQYAEQYLDAGFYLGFTGIITYPPKKTDPAPQEWLTKVVQHVPLDRIVVETDSPYLAPHIIRGKRNEPIYVEEVVRQIATLRGLDPHALEEQIEHNTKTLFNLS